MDYRRTEPDMEEGSENPYIAMRLGPSVPHYYGDYVRQIFFVAGAAMLILSVFFDSGLPIALPFEIGGALLFVFLGAFTNPNNSSGMLINAVAAGVAVVAYELLALSAYFNQEYLAFVEREALTLAFLAALYFSLKTYRNMASGRIGKRNTYGEFVEPGDQRLESQPGDGD